MLEVARWIFIKARWVFNVIYVTLLHSHEINIFCEETGRIIGHYPVSKYSSREELKAEISKLEKQFSGHPCPICGNTWKGGEA